MNVNCNSACTPSSRTLHPEAEHYLDCPIWQSALRHSSLEPAVSGTPQRPATATQRHRSRFSVPGRVVVDLVLWSAVVGMFSFLFGVVFGWWG